MCKPILTILLFLFFTGSATAQQRKLYSNPYQPGMLLDSSQMKLLLGRNDFEWREVARKQDSLLKESRRLLTITKVKSFSTALANSCTVKASFTPGNDTTLYTGQSITFTNTSLNADSYEWIVDTYFNYSTTDLLNYVPAVGITPVLLVAHQGTCTDTAITYIVRNGTPPVDQKRMTITYGMPNTNEFGSTLVNAKIDGYLLGGISGQSINGYLQPYFVRVSETGCILWSTLLAGTSKPELHTLITTYDSGFVVEVVQREDFYHTFLLKIDKNGNILWERSYQGNDGLNWAGSIKEMSDHSLMVMSGQFGAGNFVLTKLNESGGFLWQKRYAYNAQDQAVFTDLVENKGYAWVAGTYYQWLNPVTNQFTWVPMLFKIDAVNGNLQWAKGYYGVNKLCAVNGLHFYKDGLIMNGFADSLVDPVNGGYSNLAFLQEMDLNGNLREGKAIHIPNELNGPIGNNLIVDENNNIQFFYSGEEEISMQPLFADWTFYLRLDQNKNILWQQDYFGYTVGYMNQAVAAPSKGIAMLGSRFNSVFSPVFGLSENMVMLKEDSSGRGPDQLCDQYQSTIQDMTVIPYTPDPPVVTDEILSVTDMHYTASKPNSELRYNCPDYVPLCSFMKLSGKHFLCNMKDTLEFIAHKDPSCNDPVIWTYDVSYIKTTYQDGGKARLLFNAPGVYKILAEKPFPCTSIFDSMYVTVAPGLIHFNLGNDTTFCTGDTILLKPTVKYDQYLWQDGSVNDSFIVKTAGDYHVMVTDSCGNTKADTIHVDFKSSLALDLGATQTICPADSVFISPPAGFLRYDWTPDYNLIHGSGGNVILFPRMDTVYRLVVHDNGSCSGQSDLKIQLFPANKPGLGNDTAICTGGDARFIAAGNFISYYWNDGETTASIDVHLAGQYIVTAEDQNHCLSTASVYLIVYPTPVVHINGGDVLCKDQALLLDAGAGFIRYVWQDGSQREQFNITDTGTYRVDITDNHHCAAADSIHIAAFAESPKQFLPADTIVCSYTGALIRSSGDFVQYKWSTGETGKSIHVMNPGEFMLQVVDQEGCIGKDTIRIDMKNCEALLVFPNAFTPNHDGVNDIFRLKYPGHVVDYQLQVFNRWGQRIFSTVDPFAGWDGRFESNDQPTGTYTWMARYTDNNGNKQTLSGTVVLIR